MRATGGNKELKAADVKIVIDLLKANIQLERNDAPKSDPMLIASLQRLEAEMRSLTEAHITGAKSFAAASAANRFSPIAPRMKSKSAAIRALEEEAAKNLEETTLRVSVKKVPKDAAVHTFTHQYACIVIHERMGKDSEGAYRSRVDAVKRLARGDLIFHFRTKEDRDVARDLHDQWMDCLHDAAQLHQPVYVVKTKPIYGFDGNAPDAKEKLIEANPEIFGSKENGLKVLVDIRPFRGGRRS